MASELHFMRSLNDGGSDNTLEESTCLLIQSNSHCMHGDNWCTTAITFTSSAMMDSASLRAYMLLMAGVWWYL